MTAEQRDMAERYLPAARALAKPYKERWPRLREEFESAACLALVTAAGRYDAAMRVRFLAYARHRIVGSLKDVLLGEVPKGYEHCPDRAPAVGRLAPTLPAPSHAEADGMPERSDRWAEWLACVTPSQARTLHAVYIEGRRPSGVAAERGITKQAVDIQIRRSYAKIRAYLERVDSEGQPPDV